jgi:hypothetical protein
VERETYESLNLAPKPLRPHILAAATIVYGNDYYSGKRETINLSGFVQMNKWPMPGFEHRVDEKGRAVFDTELISAPEVGIKGFSYELNDRIQILSNPLLPNTGHVRQVAPGKNFPAEFHIQRFGILETSTLRLVHRNVIDIYGVVDAIPPFKKPLSGGYLGAPRGDQPMELVPAPNVVRGTTLPEAWYPSDDENRPIGITPTVFFASSPAACMSMLVDPTMIMQTSTEATLSLDVAGRAVRVDLAGDHTLAAGMEVLLFGPEKHYEGGGVVAQLARVAMLGECAELGGRVMLRASWPKPSGGTLGEGDEESLSRVKFPGELHFDAELELVTPHEVLYATSPVHLHGQLKAIEPEGTNLAMSGPGAALVTAADAPKARITGLTVAMRESIVGEHAVVNV